MGARCYRRPPAGPPRRQGGAPDNPTDMHLLIPHASALSETARHTLRELALPNLTRLLTRLTPGHRVEGDEYLLTPPHERALADAWGWRGGDGLLPFAAHAAASDGIDVGADAWGLITPVHWHVGRDFVSLVDPAALQLEEAESRALFDAVRELFESEGFRMAWGAPSRWYAAHRELGDLACASVDRVVGRNVDLWLKRSAVAPVAKLLRRLQSEVQLLLYPHPINEAREARGALTVNSFWLSGCGVAQPAPGGAIDIDDRLRVPLMSEDWAAWAQAWRDVDGSALAALAQRAAGGSEVCLTLAGERHAQRYETRPRSLWRSLAGRWDAPAAAAVLEAL